MRTIVCMWKELVRVKTTIVKSSIIPFNHITEFYKICATHLSKLTLPNGFEKIVSVILTTFYQQDHKLRSFLQQVAFLLFCTNLALPIRVKLTGVENKSKNREKDR